MMKWELKEVKYLKSANHKQNNDTLKSMIFSQCHPVSSLIKRGNLKEKLTFENYFKNIIT